MSNQLTVTTLALQSASAKIAKIDAIPLRIPFKPRNKSAPAAWGGKDLAATDLLLVRVTTNDGLEGWGEAFGFRAVASAKLALEELIGPLCVGSDALQIGPLMSDIQEKLHIFGESSPPMSALSAVDIALWDIAGKAADTPVYKLLGGGVTDRLPCYASLERFSDPALVRESVRRALDSEFRSLKLHEVELPAVRAAREEAGSDDLEIMLDVNCAWTLYEAQAMAEKLEEFHLKWLEEPVSPPENYDGLARVRRLRRVPIAAGENVSTLMDFGRLISAQAVDFVQPSPAKMGGITELRKVFPLAAIHDVVVMPHTLYDGPGLLAAIHGLAALGTADSMIEWRYFDLEASVYADALAPERGQISVPQGPGLGIDPHPDVIQTYLREVNFAAFRGATTILITPRSPFAIRCPKQSAGLRSRLRRRIESGHFRYHGSRSMHLRRSVLCRLATPPNRRSQRRASDSRMKLGSALLQ
jgi:L-alanine-DL-glutamate epimerase-like enolase superfamily enzyme